MERISDGRMVTLRRECKEAADAAILSWNVNRILSWAELSVLVQAYRTPAGLDRMERAGVYVASRASTPERGEMWRKLRASGVKVTASWIDEDGPGQTADFTDLWARIQHEVTRSERLILYVEPDDFPLKGALIEVGMALAAGVPVIVVAPGVELEPRNFRPLGSWVKHALVAFERTVSDAIALGVVASPEGNSSAASLPVSEQTVPEPAGDIASEGVRRWDEATGSFVYDYADSALPSASPPEPEAKTGGAQSLDKWAALMAQASELSEKIDAELHAPSPAPAVGVDGWRWVPIEPTCEMRAAAYPIIEASATERALHTWRAMLSAAPASLPAGTLRVTPDTLNAAVRAVSRLPTDTVMCEPSKVVDAVLAALSTSPLAKGDG